LIESEIAVNVAGFLRGGLGLGEAARLYVAALQSAGVAVQTTAVDPPLPETEGAVLKRADFSDLPAAGRAPYNLVCVNPPELPRFYHDVGPGFFDGRCSIGSWAWEVNRVPADWAWAFAVVDEIWAYSAYVEQIFRAVAPVPVARVPLPVVAPEITVEPPDLGVPENFTFLFLFDFFSTIQRKNPFGVIEAFTRAFRPGEGPQLLVKSINGDYKPDRLARVRAVAARHPDVHVVDRFVSAAERDALIATCDCYVSLHRAEGFGLPLAEAMALGRPVIATGWSGNLDFMSEDNAWLVRHKPMAVGPEGENYPADGVWADPNLDHAAELMRAVWQDRDTRERRVEHARRDVLEGLSLERVGRIARERLERIELEGRPTRAAPSPPPAGTAWGPLRLAGSKVEYDPLKAARAAGGARNLARAAALRAMKPFTYHQEELNEALFTGLTEVAERLDRLAWELEGQAALDEHGRAQLRRLIAAADSRPAPRHPWISPRDDQPGLRFDERDPRSDAYVAFEELFRGAPELIRARQAAYVDMLADRGEVLELGPGRGEFLALLAERGVSARGVELDPGMAARAREQGHDVVERDALEHLRGLPDRTVPAIFAAQFVEHLPAPALVELLRLIEAKLEADGIAILETINPHSAWALKAFWVDPTHHHPLFPEVLLAFARFAGFRSGRVEFPGGSGDFEHDIYTQSDYAVVLRT